MFSRVGMAKVLLSTCAETRPKHEDPELSELFFLGDINLSDYWGFRLESRILTLIVNKLCRHERRNQRRASKESALPVRAGGGT
jgi:hypothetical protein